MNRLGHMGAVMLILSPFVKYLSAEFVALAALFTLAPDVDLVLKVKHREYTHNVTFAVLLTLAVFFIFKARGIDAFYALAAFIGVAIHIAVDLLTLQKFAPLYPFSRKKYALKLFRSDNAAINSTSFVLGTIAFVYFYAYAG